MRVTGGRLVRAGRGPVRGASVDSRRVRPGDLFVAVRGERVDGHDFVAEAFRRGAVAALVSREVEAAGEAGAAGEQGALIRVDDTVAALGRLAAYHRQRLDVTVVAVTGSVGKTTTKDMIAAVLATAMPVLKSPGNYNTEIGLPLTLLELTPEHKAAVLEMGMRGAGQIRYLARIARPRIGCLTVVGETHLELLGSVENIARAKGELLEELPAGGAAVLNADDPWQRRLAPLTAARVVWYGFDPSAQVTAADVVTGGSSTTFTLRADVGRPVAVQVTLPLPGRHHVLDALAAAAVGLLLGVPPEGIAGGLAATTLSAMRCQVTAGAFTVIDDTYNASPASAKAALSALAEAGGARRVAVLADMLELGPRAVAGHREVGETAACCADLVVAVGDLARHIAAGALAAGLPPERVIHCGSRAEALGVLERLVRPGDVVLVKGSRGMRMEEVAEALVRWAGAPARGGAGGEGGGR